MNNILNFGGLDAVPGNLQLVVDTPHKMEQPAAILLDGVARAVPSCAIRVGGKGVTAIWRVKVA